jgi:hypothetical protein
VNIGQYKVHRYGIDLTVINLKGVVTKTAEWPANHIRMLAFSTVNPKVNLQKGSLRNT